MFLLKGRIILYVSFLHSSLDKNYRSSSKTQNQQQKHTWKTKKCMLGALATIQTETFLRNIVQDKPKIKMAVTTSTDMVQSQAHQ